MVGVYAKLPSEFRTTLPCEGSVTLTAVMVDPVGSVSLVSTPGAAIAKVPLPIVYESFTAVEAGVALTVMITVAVLLSLLVSCAL